MSKVKSIDRIAGSQAGLLTIRENVKVAEAARMMSTGHVGCLLVVNAYRQLVGILSERDILRDVVAKAADPMDLTVGDIMRTNVVSCRMDTSITQAQKLMAKHRIRHLPILEGDDPVGMVSSRDIHAHKLAVTEALAEHQSHVLNELENRYPGITQIETDNTGRVVI
ncbi:MAG: CBS domain-containing protein [Phycisphaerae bacterium]